MFRRKLIRLGSALLMIMALTLPVAAPASAQALTLTSVSPNSGPDEGTNTVTLTGTGFLTGATLMFGAVATVAPPVVVSATSMTAVVPPSAVMGPVTVTVTNPPVPPAVVGATASCTGCYIYQPLTVTSLTPSSGPAGSIVTLNGTGFAPPVTPPPPGVPGPGDNMSVTFGGVLVAVTIVNTTTATFMVPTTALPGTTNVVATDPTPVLPEAPAGTTLPFVVTGTTATPTGTIVGTVTGGQTVTGSVTGVSPAGLRPNAHVVLVSQTSTASYGAHTGTSTTSTTPGTALGTFSIPGVTPGQYRLSVADNDEDVTGCAATAGTPCGHLIFTQLVTVLSTGATAVPAITLAPKQVPGALPNCGTAVPPVVCAGGIFGVAADATTGNPLVNGVVNVTGPGASTAVAGSTVTGADGRFSVGLAAIGTYTVTLIPPAGTCTAGSLTDLCVDTVAVTPIGTWSDPAFLVVGAGVLPTPSAQGVGTGVLQGVIPLVFRDTDTSRTGGVDIETEQIRVLNAGPARTIACLDFRSSDVDGRVTTVQRQCLDLNPNAAGIFSGDIIPSGIMGMAEMYSIDFDGVCTAPGLPTPIVGAGTATPTAVATATPGTSAIQGCVYDVSDLAATIMYRVAEADNATAGTNALTCEDVAGSAIGCGNQGQTTAQINQNSLIPLAFKNYGGTPAKWDSVVNVCMTSSVPGRQPIVLEFRSGAGFFLETRSTDPGGCISFNMRDITYLPDGTYAISLTSTGLLGPTPSLASGFITPNALFGAAVAYSRQGKTATATNSVAVFGGGTQITTNPNTPNIIPINRVYVPLIFGDYTVGGGSWWTGLGIVNFPITGTSGTVNFTLTVYDDAGTVRGVTAQGLSGSSAPQNFWLGQQPGTENRGLWFGGQLVIPLERNFRGAAIIDAGDASQVARPVVYTQSTNYARLAALSYNGIRDEVVNPAAYGRPAQAPNTRPCVMSINISVPADTCLWAAEAVRVARGPTTGVRLFNTGALAEQIDVQYFDSAGVEWTDSRTTFTIGPFSTATIFMGTDFRLPAQFNGSVYLQSSQDVTAMANVIDYGITTRDSARSYNLSTNSGLTQ